MMSADNSPNVLQRRPSVLFVGGCDVHRRLDLMRALAQDFDVLAAGSHRPSERLFEKYGFDYHYYPLERGPTPMADFRSVIALFQLFKRCQPVIVHAFATKPCVWGRIAARWAGVPVVVGTLPGLGSLYVNRSRRVKMFRILYQALQKTACQVSDVTVFQNARDEEELIARGVVPRSKSNLIAGSGVRTDRFSRTAVQAAAVARFRQEVQAPEDTVLVCLISRMIRTKGILDFVAAADILRARKVAARFVLVGPDDRESVDSLDSADLARVRQRALWLGERQDVPTILAASDVFVLPSYYREGIPRVLLEAASMELPLVASRIAGCTEVVEDGRNGFLVQPRDPPQLADAIEKLATNRDLRTRFGRESRQIATSRFDVSVVAAKTSHLYWSLLNGRRTSFQAAKPISVRRVTRRDGYVSKA